LKEPAACSDADAASTACSDDLTTCSPSCTSDDLHSPFAELEDDDMAPITVAAVAAANATATAKPVAVRGVDSSAGLDWRRWGASDDCTSLS
jgi:hypothetical protein